MLSAIRIHGIGWSQLQSQHSLVDVDLSLQVAWGLH